MNKRIAVVDDEEDIRELISLHLTRAGFDVSAFESAEPFLQQVKVSLPDLLVLDLMLPGLDGIEVCKQLRSDSQFDSMGIIMLTAKSSEVEKILGLELGADDYVTKPFSPYELVARVKAVLRRQRSASEEKVIQINEDLKLDLNRHEITLKGKVLPLTSTEFKIFTLLSSKRGWVYSREQILNYLWNNEKYVIDRTVDVHIKHLREKLGEYGSLIRNVRGVGYKLES